MAFRVEISPQAFDDLDSIANYIRRRANVETAERWFDGIVATIETLRDVPQRCSVSEESRHLHQEVRLLFYGKLTRRYKIYFAIHSKTIRILHVRHWARKPVDVDELDELIKEEE